MTEVLITGGSRGIGKACAQRFAAAGCRLTLVARQLRPLEAISSELQAAFGAESCQIIAADLATEEGCKQVLQSLERQAIIPEVLINNAGRFATGNLTDESPDQLTDLLALNLLAAYRLGRALIPAMLQRGHGQLITIGSVAVDDFPARMGQYTLTKMALHALHQNWAHELADTPLQGSLIVPGATLTSSWDNADFIPEAILSPATVAEEVYAAYQQAAASEPWTTVYLRP
ncbi:MAG: SDR family oxidoreductase [Bacteroidota bacterium]